MVLTCSRPAKLALLFSYFGSAATSRDFAPEPFTSARRFLSDSAAVLPFGKKQR
jgi:hypothetical protein